MLRNACGCAKLVGALAATLFLTLLLLVLLLLAPPAAAAAAADKAEPLPGSAAPPESAAPVPGASDGEPGGSEPGRGQGRARAR